MKVRETIGTVRTMLNMEVTTDGDQHQDDGECDYRHMGERMTATSEPNRSSRPCVALGWDIGSVSRERHAR